jgi:hypothetical protein
VSESRRAGRRWRWYAAGLPLLLAGLLFALGPSLLLKALLTWTIPSGTGLTISYREADAGFLFRSARVRGLKIEAAAGELFSVDQMEVQGLSVRNFLKLVRNPENLPAGPLFLARELTLHRFSHESPRFNSSLQLGQIRDLELMIRAPRYQAPLSFEKLELRGLNLALALNHSGGRLELGLLEARKLAPESLGALLVQTLTLDAADERHKIEFSLTALTVGGLQTSALARLFSRTGNRQFLWGLLSGCDRLELAQARLELDRREAVSLKSARFDLDVSPGGEQTLFTRRLNFAADPEAIPLDWRTGFSDGLRDILGGPVQGELNLELAYQKRGGRADLRRAVLDLPALGRLNFNCLLSGVSGLKPHQNFYQILYGPAARWRLEKLGLTYEDDGLAGNIYRRLDQTVFRQAPGRPTADNILAYYLNPLARNLEYEQGLSNLPAILSEVETFLRDPRSFGLSAEPARSLVAIFKNPDKYDIIEKLHPTITVNRRAPVTIGVASGVFHERLPISPQPMEKAFTEENF